MQDKFTIHNNSKLLTFPLDTAYQSEIEHALVTEYYKTGILMGCVILGFQAIMMLSSILRGGLMLYIRKELYFAMYALLFIATCIFLFISVLCHKKIPINTLIQVKIMGIYAFILSLWSCGITLLDQYKGSELSVFCYILMTLAVFNIVKPWQILILFLSNFIFLNLIIIICGNNPLFFTEPPNIFSNIINSFFIVVLATLVSTILYRYRVFHHYNQILIRTQYEEICNINKSLNQLVLTDQLTHMGNRRYLEEKIIQHMSCEDKEKRGAIGMMIDIDFFKQYNDTYGHQAGDECLHSIAEVLLDFAKETGAFAVRYGGEEFFICIQGTDQVKEKAEYLMSAIAAKNLLRDDLPLKRVTASIGVSVEMDIREIGQDEFLRRCDKALYIAKNSGRNCTAYFDHTEL